MFEKAKLWMINFSRKHLRNTWIHRLPITSKIYKKIFLSLYKNDEKEISFRGNKYIVPTKDVTVVPSMISGDYEKYELDLFNNLSKGKRTILDIGANLGVYSVEAARASRNSKIYAFEPIPENVISLTKNLELNNLNNVHIEKIAAGDKKTKTKIYLADNSVGTHSMGKMSNNYIEIGQDTIDNFRKKHSLKVDLIKMDIEGYEPAAIDGAKQTIKNDSPVLFIEFSANHLKRCGFDPSKHAKKTLSLYKYTYMVNEKHKKVTRIYDYTEIHELLNINLILSPNPINF